jgi:hypothetical protein
MTERMTLNAAELDAYECQWKRVFAVAAAALVVALVYLVALQPSGTIGFLAYTLGAIAVCVCLYAGKRLRDVERVNAVVHGSWLREAHRPNDLDVADD